ncbi:hypothetical protein DMNBHIDG_00036 [Candidatus Methanoperedenaceae archaeon GB37]|nr:hypothetical protein DMNBHIDG_00036 [Candidatus Methanoperedenaceae archaeon GB37]
MGGSHQFGIQFRPWYDDNGVAHNTADGYNVIFEDKNGNGVYDPGQAPPNREEIRTVDLRGKNVTLAVFLILIHSGIIVREYLVSYSPLP